MPERARWTRGGSVVLLAVSYLLFLGFGGSIVASFEALLAPQPAAAGGGGISGDELTARWSFTVVGLIVAGSAVALSAIRQKSAPPPSTGPREPITAWMAVTDCWQDRRPHWWWRAAATAGVYGLAQAAANWINTGLQSDHAVAAAGFDTSNSVWSALAESACAGIGEELILVAALVIVLARAGLRFRWTILVIGIVARLLFHVHYGAGTVGLVLWAAVALTAYYYWRSIIPMIVLHTWHNVAALWDSQSWWVTPTALWVIPTVCAAAAAATVCVRRLRYGSWRDALPAATAGRH
ncbi:MAG: CPBP family glutamic-type intramembrane protease [Tomitella sp.]|nr:CPBP family glutamic-type intramembrane protease [Tomitella sp.]